MDSEIGVIDAALPLNGATNCSFFRLPPQLHLCLPLDGDISVMWPTTWLRAGVLGPVSRLTWPVAAHSVAFWWDYTLAAVNRSPSRDLSLIPCGCSWTAHYNTSANLFQSSFLDFRADTNNNIDLINNIDTIILICGVAATGQINLNAIAGHWNYCCFVWK